MTRRRPAVRTRTDWHQSPSGCWSLSLGERGCRVRVTQRAKGAVFVRETWIPGQGRHQASLGTASRVEARRLAEAFLRSLNTDDTAPTESPLTLTELWTLYQKDSTQYRQNTPRTRQEKDSRMTLLLLGLGARSRVDRLTISDCERYAELRRRGTGWPDRRITPAVRARTVGYDFQTLRAVIRWACTVRKPDGSWLVQENPLRGLRVPKESNVRRPLATHDRFLAVRKAMRKLAAEVKTEHERVKWARLELALVLAEATGRRVGSIRGLRWADFAADPPAITWRAEYDKRRREQTVPIPQALADEVRSFRVRIQALGDGWVFRQLEKDEPWHRKWFDELLRKAEKAAELTPLPGGLWHPYRRKWATERRHLPAVDVMKAGGWTDRTTMETCYQQATDADVLAVMESPAKLRDAGVVR